MSQISCTRGYLELLKYILNGGNYKLLIGTSALTNYSSVNNYINSEYILC